jgi:hypothetical protein
MVKMCNRPLEKTFYSFALQPPPPLAGTSQRVQRLQAGLGLVVHWQAELGLGGRECWEGECENSRPFIARIAQKC